MEHRWLKTRREKLNFSQDELAAELQRKGLNVTRGSISHWEQGRYNPPLDDPEFMKILAKTLHTTVLEILQEIGYEITPEGLTKPEIHAIEAWRRGDKFEAIKAIVNE